MEAGVIIIKSTRHSSSRLYYESDATVPQDYVIPSQSSGHSIEKRSRTDTIKSKVLV